MNIKPIDDGRRVEEDNKTINRKFNVPVLNEPFDFEFTQRIYNEKESDVNNENNGKPFDSFVVHSGRVGGSSKYIRTIEEAESEVYKRINKSLESNIEYCENRLKRLKEAKTMLDKNGIKVFEKQGE